MHERPRGGLPPFEDSGLREIVFVDSRSSCDEDRLGRSGAFKRAQFRDEARYSAR